MNRDRVISAFRAAQRAGLTVRVSVGGLALTGTLNTAREEVVYTAYGNALDYLGTVLVATDDLTARPRKDAPIEVGSSRYRVIGVREIDTVVTAIDYSRWSLP